MTSFFGGEGNDRLNGDIARINPTDLNPAAIFPWH